MKQFESFEEAYEALKNNQIVMFYSPFPTFCYANNNKITLISKSSHFIVSAEVFTQLYCEEIFYLYENEQVNDIDNDKDDEYYGLRYQ